MRFRPPRCPYPDCPRGAPGTFAWSRKGFYRRRCDGRRVQRFLCLRCRRRFSTQSFRLDRGLHLPRLHLSLYDDMISKVTMRQSARLRRHSRVTIAHRLRLLGRHCRDSHAAWLRRTTLGDPRARFQLDELETYETDRRLCPVTVPILIESRTYFVIDARTAPLPARGGLSPAHRRRKALLERRRGRRRSGSSRAVRESFAVLERLLPRSATVKVRTDRKSTYPGILRAVFGNRARHQRSSSRAKRNYGNALFPINHTLAFVRDNLSRLVRRTWAAAKLRERLELHLAMWIVWRNYFRGITVRAPRVTPAMALGVAAEQWSKRDFFRWRSEFPELIEVH